jgi:hypothetical protein
MYEQLLRQRKLAQARYPGKVFFLGRIGHRTVYTFKGHLRIEGVIQKTGTPTLEGWQPDCSPAE